MFNLILFKPPEEPLPWDDTLLVHEPGNACVQDKANIILVSHWNWRKFDEDCLTVNIYTPQVILLCSIYLDSSFVSTIL